MKNLAKFISILVSLLAILLILSALSLVFSEDARNNPNIIVHSVIAIGCFVYPFAMYLLLAMFVLLGWELWLRKQRMAAKTAAMNGLSKWKVILLSEDKRQPFESLLSSFAGLLLFLALASQLVWFWYKPVCF